MAKAPKKDDQTEPTAELVPAPLAAAIEEADPVMQAHITRQANHFHYLAPSLAKQTREDLEREEELAEHQKIAGSWADHIAEQQRIQRERDEKENAHGLIASIGDEITAMEALLLGKKAELDRLMNLVKG